VIEKGDSGEVTLHFPLAGADLFAALERHGHTPLPPYIRRGRDEARDETDYQTVWGTQPGAVAASTAGLHFTPRLIAALDAAGIARAAVTLHVGAGTFLPVKVDDTDDHVMHSEWGSISAETVAAIENARSRGARVVATGTTVLRIL